MTVEQHQEVLEIEPGGMAELKRLADEQGVEVEEIEVRGLEKVALVLVMLTGLPPAIRSVLHSIDFWRGGQVIDLRPGAERVRYRSRDIQYGLVLVHAFDGTDMLIHLPSEASSNEARELLAKALLALPSRDSKSVADATKLALGEAVSITDSSPKDAPSQDPS